MITEQKCFCICLVSVISASSGLPNPWVTGSALPKCFGNLIFSNVGGGITEPELLWNSFSSD